MIDRREACLDRFRGAAVAEDDWTDSKICSTSGDSLLPSECSPP